MNATRLLNLFEDLKSLACCVSFQGVVAAVGVAAMCTPAHAAPVTLNAVQDTTIFDRPSSGGQRDQNFDGSGLQIWNNGAGNSTSGRRRDIIFQFDLSSLAPTDIITAAHLEYFVLAAGDHASANPAFVNNTSLVTFDPSKEDDPGLVVSVGGNVAFDKNGMHEQFVTFNSSGTGMLDAPGSFWTGQWQIFKPANPALDVSSLNLSLELDNTLGLGYRAGGSANQATLDRLNFAKDNNGFALFIADYVTGGRSFGDVESGNPIRLVLEVQSIPEPTSVVLALIGGIGIVGVSRRSRRRAENG